MSARARSNLIRHGMALDALSFRFASPNPERNYTVEISKEERLRGVVRVALYTSGGALMQVKKGLLHQGRCTVKWLGKEVEATQVNGRWVFRVPALKSTEDA